MKRLLRKETGLPGYQVARHKSGAKYMRDKCEFKDIDPAILSGINVSFLFKLFHVDLVLSSSGSLLVTDQILKADECNIYSAISTPDCVRLCIPKRYSVDVAKEVDATWLDSKRKHIARCAKGALRKVLLLESERNQGIPQAANILLGRVEEDIDVFGEPGIPVKGYGISSDNHILNVVLFE